MLNKKIGFFSGFWIRIDLMRILIQIRIQHFLNCGSGFRIQIQGWWSKIEKNYKKFNNYFFWSKIAIYLSLGLHKIRPSYRRSLQPSKDKNSILFSIFSGHFSPPGSGFGSAICMWIRFQQLKLMRIHADPKPWFFFQYVFVLCKASMININW